MEPTVTVLPDHDGLRVLQCSGEFDADAEGGLDASCDEAIAAAGVERLALDVRGITFADSSFLNLLLRVHGACDLVLLGPLPPQLDRLLEMTGANLLFAIDDGPAERSAG
ncbi:STAS domain-containing protein [Streptomyces sp. NPDC048272]|uniref:STAS domain-containing protein n=1 Tax=Streptomyces sp. NPDC048272 TaxID=3154616 RepID=UPI003440C08B